MTQYRNENAPYKGQFGAFKDITRETYQLKMEQFSQSKSAFFDKVPADGCSPLHYWYEYLNPDAPPKEITDSLLFGDAFHTSILEPDEFRRRAIWWNNPQGKGLSKTIDTVGWKKAVEDISPSQMLLPEGWKETIEGIVGSITNNKDIMDLLSMPGENELTLLYKDEVTELECKSRLDRCIPEFGLIPDLKTARSASYSGFRKSIREYGYHVQNAAYFDAFRAVYGTEAAAMPFIVVEKEPPYACAVWYLDDEDIDIGRYLWNNRKDRFAECVRRQYWPSYQEKPGKISLEGWYRTQAEKGEI